jgi:hypothetical protein
MNSFGRVRERLKGAVVSDPHSHRLIRAYEEGRAAFPSIFHNPYADTGDLSAARMRGLAGSAVERKHEELPLPL